MNDGYMDLKTESRNHTDSRKNNNSENHTEARNHTGARKRLAMKKSRLSLLFFIMLLTLLLLYTFGPELKAMALMTWWNRVQKKECLLSDCGLSLEIPGGFSTLESDWFPFVMTFNADPYFSRYCRQPDLRLTVLYNFPAWSIKNRCSRLYDPRSPYYNSFYGAYVVRNSSSAPYGFHKTSDGRLECDPASIAKIPYFDYSQLVLGDFGLREKDFVFDWQITGLKEKADYLGLTDWTVIESDLRVSGAYHRPKQNVFSYNQYGRPSDTDTGTGTEDFSPAAMQGRIYARYFPEKDVSVFLYIVASDQTVLDRCDKSILSKSRIK